MGMMMAAAGAYKSSLPAVNSPMTGLNGTNYSNSQNSSATINFNVNSDGTWDIAYENNFSPPHDTGDWAVTPVAGVGNSFWVKFTRTAFVQSGEGGTRTATATTGWLALTTNQGVVLTAADTGSGQDGQVDATYTVEIASDSGGSNIVSTSTGVSFTAYWFI